MAATMNLMRTRRWTGLMSNIMQRNRCAASDSPLSSQRSSLSSSSAAPESSPVLVDSAPRTVRQITLNRPKQLNALNTELCSILLNTLEKWETDASVGGVMMIGAGEKAFCAGGDVRSLYDAGIMGDVSLASNFFKKEYAVDYLISTYRKPIISIIDGITMGGGVGISMHGRYVIATDKTMFAMPETALGLFPDVGASHFLTRAKLHSSDRSIALALYLGLTGKRLKGPELKQIGLATHIVKSESVPMLIQDLKAILCRQGERIDDMVCEAISMYSCHDMSSEEDGILRHSGAIERCFRYSTIEEIVNELEVVTAQPGKSEDAEWARSSLSALKAAAPISLKVTLQQMLRACGLSRHEIFRMDYRIASRFVRGKSFYEGVRSILVDKDRSPKWDPATLEEVSDEDVKEYFAVPDGGDLDLDETRQEDFFNDAFNQARL